MRLSRAGHRGLLALLALPLLLSSCAPRLGWGLLLWSAPSAELHAGAVLPVYIRSNIEKLYVVGVPGTKRKMEVPLWQIELFRTRGAAERRLAGFGEYVTSYLFANRDGLPIRDTPTNAGKRVYRLREGQSVKILARSEGDAVVTGDQVLEGAWFSVLTEDGIRGYVYSNTMRLYDELVEAPPSLEVAGSGDPARRVDLVFSKAWRAEYFQAMIDEGRVDLDLVSARFGLFADAVRRQIRIELPSVSQVFNYSSIAQAGDDIVFEGSNLRIRFDGDRRLIADWSGSGAAAAGPEPAAAAESSGGRVGPGTALAGGKAAASPSATVPLPASASPDPASDPAADLPSEQDSLPLAEPTAILPPSASATQAAFIVLASELRDAIRSEETRRLNLLSAFLASGSEWAFSVPERPGTLDSDPEGPSSSRIVISRGGRFTWTGIGLVPPGYLPADLGVVEDGRSSGEATVRLSLGPSLDPAWEGVLSLRFDGTKPWLDLLYRHDGASLLLLPVASGSVRALAAEAASPLAPLEFRTGN